MRITRKHLEAKADTLNRMSGLTEPVEYNTIGSFHISGAYGGYAVHQVMNEHGGVSDLTYGHGPAREAAKFLDGMIAGFRMRANLDTDNGGE